MIGYIKGNILDIEDNKLIVETVSGVGYTVNLVGAMVVAAGEEVSLFVHTHVSETDLSLWGFKSKSELHLFECLLGVSGVGLRTAQALLLSLGASAIVTAISNEDPKSLKAPGVGKKTAERIIIDMRNKVEQFVGEFVELDATQIANNETVNDAIAAVISLGYLEADVKHVIAQLNVSEHENAQSLIKEILKHV